MTRIHNNEVNNISECNVLHDIITPPKRTKNLNIHYSSIIHGFMNTKKNQNKGLKLSHIIGKWVSFHHFNGKAS